MPNEKENKKLEQILAKLEYNERRIDHIHRWMRMRQILSIIKIIIIVAIFVSAWWYLPPILADVIDNYTSVMGDYQEAMEQVERMR